MSLDASSARGASAPAIPSAASRDDQIDAGRLLAALAVVMIHALPTELAGHPWSGPLGLVMRFAVPFFFVASGYFLGAGQQTGGTRAAIVKLAKRLLPPYAVWLLVYLAVTGHLDARLFDLRTLFTTLLYGGPAFHLWFLPFLGVSAVLALLVDRLFGSKAVAAAGVAVAVFALARGPYSPVWNDWPDVFVEPRIAASFVFLGFAAARLRVEVGFAAGIALTAIGLATQFAESRALRAAGEPFGSQHFLLGTYVYGFGVFFALKALDAPSRLMSLAATAGRASLGLYCCHLLFIWAARSVFPDPSIAHTLAVFAIASLAATATAVMMARSRLLRPIVQ